ncbi:MAG: hypothetical protein SGPRY_010687 [Prymnesium sp.]
MLGAPHAPLALTHPLLEGHRFSVASIRAGELITSWGEPFGRALLPISPGEWIRNAKTLGELKRRRERGALGCEYPNFEDYIKPCTLSEPNFKPADPVPLSLPDETFEGFIRPEGRGVGTRNYGVLLCVSSRSNAFARALERRLRTSSAFSARGGFDGDKLLTTLLGLLLHPNVGRALVLQSEEDVIAAGEGRGVDFEAIRAAADRENRRAELLALAPKVLTLLLTDFESELEQAEQTLSLWGEELSAQQRSPVCHAFFAVVDRFRNYAEAHGASAEGNPSGGNVYRGLYNIALKSLGAAMKRHPRCLRTVVKTDVNSRAVTPRTGIIDHG